MSRILVLGASSGPGASVFLRLAGKGRDVVGAGRNPEKINDVESQSDRPLKWIREDLWDRDQMVRALDDVTVVLNCGPNRWVYDILEAAGGRLERLITLGSTRAFSKYPDQRSIDMIELEKAVVESDVPSTILHPTLIYGWWNGNPSVPRVLHMLRRLPVVPLPNGGRSLLQPVMHHDVALAIEAALERPESAGKAYVVAGPEPLPYADFIRACAKADGQTARIMGVPAPVAFGLAALARAVPGLPNVDRGEIERLLEDKDFDITPTMEALGVTPRPLTQGLSEMFARRGSAV